MQLTVEVCTTLSINILQKNIKKMIDKEYLEPSQDEVYNYTLQELNRFTVNNQVFKYQAQANYLGGYRWFFLCPKCDKQANKLFLPPATAKDREQKYYCKLCHKLKNKSAIMGQNTMYQKVTRPLKRMKEIEDKIAKGHLRTEKVQELLNEYEALENKMKETPEYRLFFFKKKHGIT